MLDTLRIAPAAIVASLALLVSSCAQPRVESDSSEWRKGNLHTHSLWSDGDGFPEMVVDWYRASGYHFIALSDHNTLAEGEKYVSVSSVAPQTVSDYQERFGSDWVERRVEGGDTLIRLRTLAEYRTLLETDDFLIIQAEEITDRFESKPIHVNATNLAEVIPPQGGSSVRDVMQRNVDAVLDQRRRTGRSMFPHINHPNFGWAVTAEDIAALEGERFFEVYNGHPAVHNEGDSTHIGTDRMWDVILTDRLLHGRDILYGLAVDDAHHYHGWAHNLVNPGRGWIQVRSTVLSADSLIHAMETGDFYASTGVEVTDVRFTPDALQIEIQAENGVTYTTEFRGTRMPAPDIGTSIRADTDPTSIEVGALLARVNGSLARYEFTGNELYVRARVVSSRVKQNGYREGELEMAWIQPVLP